MLYVCTFNWWAKDKARILITLRQLPVLSSYVFFLSGVQLRLKGKPLSLTIFLLCAMCSYQCFVHFFLSFFNKSSSAPQSAADSIYFIPTFILPSVLRFPFALMLCSLVFSFLPIWVDFIIMDIIILEPLCFVLKSPPSRSLLHCSSVRACGESMI